MRVLVIEDELYLADTIKDILKMDKYLVDVVNDGETGYENARTNIYDLILLDIMLPKINGLEVLKRLRANDIKTPVILLTAKSEVTDKVEGLDAGADDYIPKPFNSSELLARVRARLRRKADNIDLGLPHFGDLQLDKKNLTLYKENKSVTLTLKEAELMEFFLTRKTDVSAKDTILERIWGYDTEADYNHVEVYISFLRKKLSYLKSHVKIHTVRGIGYTLKDGGK